MSAHRRPSGENVPGWPVRIVARPAADAGRALLAPISPHATLSSAQERRLTQRMEGLAGARGQVAGRAAPWPGRLALATAMLLGLVIGAALTTWLARDRAALMAERGVPAASESVSAPQDRAVLPGGDESLVVPTCAVQALATSDPGGTLSLVGPSQAVRDPRGQRPLRLLSGRLQARARSTPLAVEAPGVRVSVAAGATLELQVEIARVVIAAQGSSVVVERIEQREPPQRFTVEPGGSLVLDGKTAVVTPPTLATLPAGAAADGEGWSGLLRQSCEAQPDAGAPAPSSPRSNVTRKPETVAAVAMVAPAPAPAALPAARVARRQKPPLATSPVAEVPLAAEARVLAEAQRAFHGEQDVARALAALKEHRRRFSAGVLAPERDVLELEVLLKAGRHAEALRRLDGLALGSHARGRELHLLRGELRAGGQAGSAGGCVAALQDFGAALRGDRSRLEARALFGRGACQVSLGQGVAGRANLTQYLARFPSGRSADAARRLLGAPAP